MRKEGGGRKEREGRREEGLEANGGREGRGKGGWKRERKGSNKRESRTHTCNYT